MIQLKQMKQKKLALILPIFNKLSYTIKCFQWLSIARNNYKENNLLINYIVVDDGSTDGSSEWLKTNIPEAKILTGDGNLWWSGAVNMGVKYALSQLNCDYILLWNNDIKPHSEYFNNLDKVILKSRPDTIISSKIYYLDFPDIIVSMGGRFNNKSGKYNLYGFGEKDNENFENIIEADWFGGMGTTIHKKVFETIGYFNEKNFPQYHGDSDFGLRAKKAGIGIFVFPELKIWNDRKNTGFSNYDSFKIFLKSLTSIKSNFNIKKEIRFYRTHAESIFAYKAILRKYFRHIGGFFKWKILGLFNINRKTLYY
jgi:GT2 family glycosyltransferase